LGNLKERDYVGETGISYLSLKPTMKHSNMNAEYELDSYDPPLGTMYNRFMSNLMMWLDEWWTWLGGVCEEVVTFEDTGKIVKNMYVIAVIS